MAETEIGTKRPIMGEIAGRMADFVIVTSDNPRTEDPLKIIADILEGIKRQMLSTWSYPTGMRLLNMP